VQGVSSNTWSVIHWELGFKYRDSFKWFKLGKPKGKEGKLNYANKHRKSDLEL